MASEQPLSRLRYWARRFECPVDEDAGYHNTVWCNRDLIPIPPDRRTWDWTGFAGYWVITGINTTAWTFGSSLLSLGLSVPQAMGVSVGCSLLTAIIAVVAGWAGSHQHLGFTVMCRSSWGMRGGFWPVLNRIMTAIIWLGIQMYWGGQAVKIILGALIGPKVRSSAHDELISLHQNKIMESRTLTCVAHAVGALEEHVAYERQR